MMRTIIFDFETTGLPLHPDAKIDKQPRVIEFGAVIVAGSGQIVSECSLLINPEQKLDATITKITGLTDAELVGKPVFLEAEPELRSMFGLADLMVAHHLPFDQFLLELELQRAAISDFPWPRYALCTVQAYQEEWGRRPKLTELYERVTGKPLRQTHRALDDVLALAEIVIKEGLINDFYSPAQGAL